MRQAVCRSRSKFYFGFIVCGVAILMSGCGGGGSSSVADAVSSSGTASTTTATVQVQNVAPVISGTPALQAKINVAFTFTPTATDANGDALSFQIANKPSWATFDTTSGKLTGTPSAADVGTYSNIVISVTDGKATSSLTAFAIAVTATSSGSVTLSWSPPTTNTDGSTLTNLAGYTIQYGTSADALTETVTISNPSISTYVVDELTPATWYFAVKAFTSNGTESDFSATASKTVS